MATFPAGPIRPLGQLAGAQSPRPQTLPSSNNTLPTSMNVVDQSCFPMVQSFIVTIPANVS